MTTVTSRAPHRPTIITLAGLLVFALSATLAPALADSGTTPNEGDAAIISRFDELGVRDESRDGLLLKIHRGELLDSEKGVEPARTTSSTKNGDEVTRMEYPDGSVAVLETEAPAPSGAISTRGAKISSCQSAGTKKGWKIRKNCVAKYSDIGISFGFQFNYSVASGKGRVDKVSSRNDLYTNHLPGRKLIDRGTKLGRKTSTSSMYAWGQTWVQTSQVGVTTTRYLEVRVKGSAWTSAWAR